MFNYAEVFSKLTYETAIITFLKKDGTVRIMLATRNLDTVALENGYQGNRLGGHDNRCNIKNGNLAVFDLVLGDTRAFNIERVLDIRYCGVVSFKEQLDQIMAGYKQYSDAYMSNYNMSLNMDTFDTPDIKVDINASIGNGGLI